MRKLHSVVEKLYVEIEQVGEFRMAGPDFDSVLMWYVSRTNAGRWYSLDDDSVN